MKINHRPNSIELLRWTLGPVLLWESGQFAFSASEAQDFVRMGWPSWGGPVLGGLEILAAVMFLIPRKRQQDGLIPAWDEFAAANSDLLTWKGHVLRRYYTDEPLQSELARKIFLLPDRILVVSTERG